MITPIGMDHAEYLGDRLLGIAGKKAGIIKPGAVAVMAAQEQGASPRCCSSTASRWTRTVAR